MAMDLLAPPLRSFLEIARLGSVSRAAQALGLTQPAVTKQVRALEGMLGSPLLERAGRGVRLTAAGELLADFGRRGARVFEDFDQALGELSRGEAGKLVIGAGVTTCVQHLPPWLREFRARHPGIDVHIATGTSRTVENWVAGAEVDIGFVTSEPRRPELAVRRLFEEEIVLVVEPNAAGREPMTLERLGLILFPKSTGFRQYLDQKLAARQLSVSVKMETDSVEAIKSFVTVGIGASFLPISTVREELRQGTLARVRARGLGPLRRRTALIWRRDRPLGFAMQGFLDVVTARRVERSLTFP
jgi:LysR family transcriptional regulator, low CO2-responsive transcriptional regulator